MFVKALANYNTGSYILKMNSWAVKATYAVCMFRSIF